MPILEFYCRTHGLFEKILPAHRDTVPCAQCEQICDQVVSKSAPPKFVGRGFHCREYPGSDYKGT